MVGFPNCKLNLGLRVLGKRSDGYHALNTCFYPIPYCDVIELISRPENNADTFHFTGLAIPGKEEDNLIARAIRLLRVVSVFPPVEVHLHKILPSGAGIGGGSSDAAQTLILLNVLFELGLSKEQLANYASALGSDCPFFIYNRPSMASGRGEILEPVKLDLGGIYVRVVVPPVHISTAEAFRHVKHSAEAFDPTIFEYGRRLEWKDALNNDFESYAFEQYPVLEAMKVEMYQAGAFYAAMSGSGSAIYGLFEAAPTAEISFPEGSATYATILPAISEL